MSSFHQRHNFIGPRERREYLLGIIASFVGDKPLFPEPRKPIEFNPTHNIILASGSIPERHGQRSIKEAA